MTIIIDAYNFIKQISGITHVSDSVLNGWIDSFKRYMKLRKNKIILVFDAGPYFQESVECVGGVEVIYAGQAQSADDVIKKWVSRHKNQDILLVTSDREIRDFAAGYDIISVNSQDFYSIFNRVVQQEEIYEQKVAHTLHKMTDEESLELDALMEQGSRFLVKSSVVREEVVPIRIRNGKKVAKQDQRVLKKLEKI